MTRSLLTRAIRTKSSATGVMTHLRHAEIRPLPNTSYAVTWPDIHLKVPATAAKAEFGIFRFSKTACSEAPIFTTKAPHMEQIRRRCREARPIVIFTAVFTAALVTEICALADALPSFPMFTSYQTARQSLLRDGWLPWRLPNASACSAKDDRCRGRPETFRCEAGGSDTCVFTWKRGNSIIGFTTRGKGAGPGVTAVKCQSGC